MKLPVMACKSGGPTESIVDGETGFLLNSDEKEWAAKMTWISQNPSKILEMGKKGRKRAMDTFGLEAFSEFLDKKVRSICDPKHAKSE